jgi:predicted transglutaminase-like cysteine proteinase
MKAIIHVAALVTLLCLVSCADLPPSNGLPAQTGIAPLPVGYADLCQQRPDLCTPGGTETVSLDHWSMSLEVINDRVNKHIRGIKVDTWLPSDDGDCKTFSISKLEQLLSFGFPRSAMHLAIAQTKDGSWHCVLLVGTDRGVYALDSLQPTVVPWSDLGYRHWSIENIPAMLWTR